MFELLGIWVASKLEARRAEHTSTALNLNLEFCNRNLDGRGFARIGMRLALKRLQTVEKHTDCG